MTQFRRLFCVLFFAFLLQSAVANAGLKAGVAKVDITPQVPAWINGYASRTSPATGVLQPIWAKALVIEESNDARIIIVTVDILGLSKEIVQDVFSAAQKKYGIRRSQLLLNSSHTHSAPIIWPCVDAIYDFGLEDQAKIASYDQELTQKIVSVIDAAMKDLSEVQLFSGHGSADFAINRRKEFNPNGPVDHDVPVLKVMDQKGLMKAVLFGYACHNTTLVDDNFQINGDYAGFAQAKLEKDNPGTTALFLMGCGGDQNPSPRGKVEYVNQHGTTLATAVQKVLTTTLKKVEAPIRTDFNPVYLAFQNFDLASYQKDIKGSNPFLQRRAKLMLEAYNKGWSVDRLQYSIQVVRFNTDLTIIGLADEVVVDYSLLFKKMFPKENLYVAGYCSEVTCYIPSKRVLKEGGYEGGESMIYYGMPGPFADDVEDRIVKAVSIAMKNVGVVASQVTTKSEANIEQGLKGTLATYAFPPKTKTGAVDNVTLIQQLKDIKANTYHWLSWGSGSDLNAFKKFLPLAKTANIKVWITLIPPSEAPPFQKDFSEPFKLDFEKWGTTLAQLSKQYSNFVAWSIDDFVHNLSFFTPSYMENVIAKTKAINPNFAFIPCAYYDQVTAQFANDYGKYLDGILFPYRNESVVYNLDNASFVEKEITEMRQLFRPGFLIFLDVYATGHSGIGESTPAYVKEVIDRGRRSADGVLIYCHQDPVKFPEKYLVVKEAFSAARK